MASIISAGTTSGTALNLTGDTSGNLAFQTGAGANTITVPNVTGTLLTNKTAGTVLQVLNTTYGTLTSTSSASYVDTGLSLSITPSSSTSKILVLVNMNDVTPNAAGRYVGLQIVRNSTAIHQFANEVGYTPSGSAVSTGAGTTYLDSPTTTSAITYKVQFKSSGNNGSVTICDSNTLAQAAIMTLMEIAG